MSKPELRNIYISKRAKLSGEEITIASKQIYEQFINQFSLTNKTVHCFKSIPGSKEIVTDTFFDYCLNNSSPIATSITKFKPRRLEHSLVTKNTTFIADNYGVPTPLDLIEIDINKIDIVIVPLLCCDLSGNRIGYGQGFYDSFLSQLSEKTQKIGVSFFKPISEMIESDTWDVKLDALITPNELFRF